MRGTKAVSNFVCESEGGNLFRHGDVVAGQGEDPSVETPPPPSGLVTHPALRPTGYPGQAQGAPGEVSVGEKVRQAEVCSLQGGKLSKETL